MKNYPYTYEQLKKDNKLHCYNHNDLDNFLNNIIETMKRNKTLDILKKMINKKNNNKFTFSYLAYLIFEKTKDTIESFNNFFPNSIKNQINGQINYLSGNYGKWDDKLNETKLDLIKTIYTIFKSKKEKIEKQNNIINLLDPESHKNIINKITEINNKFYSYNSNTITKSTKTDSIRKISQNIEQIIQEIKKTEEKDNENNKENNTIPILADKFLITDKTNKKVDIKTSPIPKINLSEINNQSNTVDAIEIEDVIQPKIYSINSLMEYYGNCILKTQMLPAFIRLAVINKNDDDQTKATKILSNLFNLYKILDAHNFSLISLRLDEFQKSFESMFSKLKKCGVDFSRDQELKKLNFSDNNQIQDFIILPEKDNFVIRASNFETEEKNETFSNNTTTTKTSRIIYNKTGIKSQESQMMNLEYESLKPQTQNKTIKKKEEKKTIEKKKKKKKKKKKQKKKATLFKTFLSK